MTIALGIDLGGTKIEIIALDESGAVLLRRRRPSPRGSYEATLKAICGLVLDAEAELGERASTGFGIPGAISPATSLLKNSNLTWLNGLPLHEDLARALDRPIATANDADCLALSEATDGAAAGACNVFAAILGTGVGGGLAIHGRLVAGPNAIAGEWGHNPLPWPNAEEQAGPRCYCGLRGCIETWLCGPGLARDFHSHTAVERDPPAIVRAAAAGDPDAEAALRRYEDRLARALATVVNLLDPQVVVLGGGCRASSVCTPTSRGSGTTTSSRTSCAPASCRRCTAIRPGYAVPPGSAEARRERSRSSARPLEGPPRQAPIPWFHEGWNSTTAPGCSRRKDAARIWDADPLRPGKRSRNCPA